MSGFPGSKVLCLGGIALLQAERRERHPTACPSGGGTATSTDMFVIFLKFHAVCYLHLYFIGIALAVHLL